MKFAGLTDKGLKRKGNEDFFIADGKLQLFMVCDGMGGHAAGEIASQTTAEIVQTFFRGAEKEFQDLLKEDTPENGMALTKLVSEAIQKASREVFQVALDSPEKHGMGTTISMLFISGQKGVVGHVGDSRVYLLRDGATSQLSEDHTVVNDIVRSGSMTREQAQRTPYAHAITRAVGLNKTVQVDTLVFDVLPGDTFLLCTDGVHDYVSESTVLTPFLQESDAEIIPAKLIEFAKSHGGRDNISAVVIRSEMDKDDDNVVLVQQVKLKLNTLANVGLFKELSLKEIMKTLTMCTVEECETDTIVVRDGDPGDRLFVLLDGEVKVTRGQEVLGHLGPGAHFGEMSLVTKRPRCAQIITVKQTRFLSLAKKHFDWIICFQHRIATKLLLALARELSSRLDDTASHEYL